MLQSIQEPEDSGVVKRRDVSRGGVLECFHLCGLATPKSVHLREMLWGPSRALSPSSCGVLVYTLLGPA